MGIRKINDTLREELKKPFGQVMDTKEMKNVLAKERGLIVSVGDICTYELLKEGITPNITIYDGKNMRQQVSEHITEYIERHYNQKIIVKNEKGTINEDAANTIRDAIVQRKNTLIKVDGEEDLLALAAIISARDGDVVVYGQPHAGMVLVKIDPLIREKALKILSWMDYAE